MTLFATAALVLFTGVGQVSAPDSLVVPVITDTTLETEILIFPPANVVLPVIYQVAWGDGETLDWTVPIKSPVDISRYHRYRTLGEYEVRCRARDGAGRTTEWGKPFRIQVTTPVLKWVFDTPDPIVAAPTLDPAGNVYVGDEGGVLYSVTPDGRLRWTFNARDAIYAAAVSHGDAIYVASVDSNLYCIDTTGKQRWSLDLDDEMYSPPALGADGTIYVGTDKGTFAAVAPNGKVRWTRKLGDEIASSPTVGANGLVYVAADSVYCFDARGRRRWSFGTSEGDYFYAAAIPDEKGVVYVGNTDGYLYCLEPNGRLRWRAPVPDGDEIRPEIVIGTDSAMYFGTDGYYLCRKTPNGTPVVIYEADDILIAPVAVSSSGTVFFLPDDGVLYGLSSSGRLLWKRDVAAGSKDLYYTSAPTIAPDGTIYVGSWDNGLYAYRGDGPPAVTWWPQYRHDAQHTGRAVRQPRTR